MENTISVYSLMKMTDLILILAAFDKLLSF